MKNKKNSVVLVIGSIIAALSLTACNSGSPSNTDGEMNYPVNEDVSIPDSPTFDAIENRGKIVIGVKEDLPGVAYLDVATQERSGFDIEIAQWIASELGQDEDHIQYKGIPSVAREQALENGDVDLLIGTYSITDERKKQVDFAGPYLETGQGLMVAKDDDAIKSKEDLVSGVNVCSTTGSTSIQKIREDFPETKTTEFDTYSQCVESLKGGQVDVITTDQALLLGIAAEDPNELKVVGDTFSTELYGVGIRKGDDALRKHIDDVFDNGGSTWQEIYDKTLGKGGVEGEQPAVDEY